MISKRNLLAISSILIFSMTCTAYGSGGGGSNSLNFNRIASFAVCSQTGSSCEVGNDETAAEIVAASTDGMTLIYSNSPREEIGFVDITNPALPTAAGSLAMPGEPTSVTVLGANALVAVNTSTDFVNTSGQLVVVDIATRTVIATLPLAGQPDSIAASRDGRYVAVVIENQRDEDLGDGAPPQLPAGHLVIVDAVGAPGTWAQRTVDLTGLATLFPGDPEVEYVDINDDNIAVVTLQENNHIVLVNLATGAIVNDFSAGTVNLTQIDATDDRPARISLSESQNERLREPDGVTWISKTRFVTADEGDLNGGSRGFTVFNTDGTVAFAAGNSLDHQAVRLGHYPDRRSDSSGNEPENAEFGRFGRKDFLFVASERSSLIFVYNIANPLRPVLRQTLPAGSRPEGVLAIPSRNLLIAASEADDRGALIRSVVNIYRYQAGAATYPTVLSANRPDGTPIPWGAISGLSAIPGDNSRVFAIDDSFYRSNRIFTLKVGQRPPVPNNVRQRPRQRPAVLATELQITDANDALANLPVPVATTGNRATTFESLDLAALINADGTVNLDPEGIAVASAGGFWIASEGAGSLTNETPRAITSNNLVLKLSTTGVIERVIRLPDALNAVQYRFGFEGITESNGQLYVAFQRAWNGEAHPRIGIYNFTTNTWSFVFYPLDAVESPNGGWVGLSEITALGNGRFALVERDNQGGPDARIKRLYEVNLAGAANGSTITKTLVHNLVPDLLVPGGSIYEKIEGLAVLPNGSVLIINDNDGVNDNSGETQLLNLGRLFN